MSERATAIQQWVDSVDACDHADRDAFAALKRALTPGRVVAWKHGTRERTGIVISVSGFNYRSASVRVESLVSGKRYHIDPYVILTELRQVRTGDRKSTRLNSSHSQISYAVFFLKKTHVLAPPQVGVGQRGGASVIVHGSVSY